MDGNELCIPLLGSRKRGVDVNLLAQEPSEQLEAVRVRSDLICSWPDNSASINLP